MERWDIRNEKGDVTGKTVVRGNVRLSPGEYHLVVHIWVVGSDGRLLIQRRAKDKELMPGEWAATGGSAVAGEDSVRAAIRELREELGIAADKKDMQFIRRLTRKNSLVDIWMTQFDIPADQLTLQPSEVSDAKWIWPMDLLRLVREGGFHNYGRDYFDTVLGAAGKIVKGPSRS